MTKDQIDTLMVAASNVNLASPSVLPFLAQQQVIATLEVAYQTAIMNEKLDRAYSQSAAQSRMSAYR